MSKFAIKSVLNSSLSLASMSIPFEDPSESLILLLHFSYMFVELTFCVRRKIALLAHDIPNLIMTAFMWTLGLLASNNIWGI